MDVPGSLLADASCKQKKAANGALGVLRGCRLAARHPMASQPWLPSRARYTSSRPGSGGGSTPQPSTPFTASLASLSRKRCSSR
ncbi:hypothetical protein OEZ85_000186 [Tetradesmus obliquus]|uniref:Uncharacterized protein n=1 Tax=Tetradesmus obliquus TaxID=3088 RepID=A0ABY8UT20_TETOB|nr:hypothetical protein OEZ85_000186 [Tetradesmus obliquus]